MLGQAWDLIAVIVGRLAGHQGGVTNCTLLDFPNQDVRSLAADTRHLADFLSRVLLGTAGKPGPAATGLFLSCSMLLAQEGLREGDSLVYMGASAYIDARTTPPAPTSLPGEKEGSPAPRYIRGR